MASPAKCFFPKAPRENLGSDRKERTVSREIRDHLALTERRGMSAATEPTGSRENQDKEDFLAKMDSKAQRGNRGFLVSVFLV